MELGTNAASIELPLHVNVLGCVLEAREGHLRRSDGDIAFGADLLALLAEGAPLLRHDWLPALEFGQSLIRDFHLFLGAWDRGHSHAFRLHDAGLES